jgi:acyl carrier protein
MALEAEFGISPELEELAELDSVAAIVDYVRDAG